MILNCHLWDKGWTPIKISPLKKYLNIYEFKEDARILLEGFLEGFRLQYTGQRIAVNSRNLVSAEVHNAEILDKLQKEVKLGRMSGPFNFKPIILLIHRPIYYT